MESQKRINPVIMDIHYSIMHIYHSIMDIHNSIMDIHNSIMDIHDSIMDIHNMDFHNYRVYALLPFHNGCVELDVKHGR